MIDESDPERFCEQCGTILIDGACTNKECGKQCGRCGLWNGFMVQCQRDGCDRDVALTFPSRYTGTLKQFHAWIVETRNWQVSHRGIFCPRHKKRKGVNT
jgi:hypothetical protein